MIRPGRSTRYTGSSGDTGSDTDALQTDVMRFMSILGLCLMAIFALVQSIPLQETDSVPPEPERQKLHQAIVLQQERRQVLEAELDGLMAQIDIAQASKTVAQRDLSRLVDATDRARSEQNRLMAELEGLQQQLAQSRDTLTGLQQSTRDQAQSLREVQQQLGEETKKLDDIQQRTREAQIKQARRTPPPATDNHPPAEPKPVKKGFTLRFASAEALDRQVATGTVGLYAMAGKQAWRLSLENGRPVFAHEAFPRWFHEMAASTVPDRYLRMLDRSVGIRAQPSVVWGVQLPPATKQGIASLTRGRQGGELVIAADGRVTLAAE